MQRFLFLPFLFLFFISAGKKPQQPPCECDYGGSFLKMAPHTKLVALVKVSKHLTFKDIYTEKTPMSMETEIIDIYKGTEERKTITVWGDPGHLCRPYLSHFKEGQYYLIAFQQAGRQAEEKPTDYAISVCGEYWLSVDYDKKIASGDITTGKLFATDTMELSQIKSELQKD